MQANPDTPTNTPIFRHTDTLSFLYPGMKNFCYNLSLKRIVSFTSGTYTKSTANVTQLKQETKLKIIKIPTE
jgi:hypothetical protein